MKFRYKFLMIAVLLMIVIVGCTIYYDISGKSYSFPVDSKFKLTEENAIEMSKRALIEAGLEIEQLVPIPWGPPNSEANEKLFARNTIDPNNGYVLWAFRNNEVPRRGYSVQLELKGDAIIANVGKFK